MRPSKGKHGEIVLQGRNAGATAPMRDKSDNPIVEEKSMNHAHTNLRVVCRLSSGSVDQDPFLAVSSSLTPGSSEPTAAGADQIRPGHSMCHCRARGNRGPTRRFDRVKSLATTYVCTSMQAC